MEKYNNLIHQPTHSFDLGINTENSPKNKEFSIYSFNNHIIATESLDDALKSFSEYFDFSVYEDEVEYLGDGVVNVN